MRKGFQRTGTILHLLGNLLRILSILLLLPLVVVFIYWGQMGEGITTIAAFVLPAAISYSLGRVLMYRFQGGELDTQGSMLLCAVAWLSASALGALPYVIGIGSGYLNAYFEAMSGFTTTGITVYTGLDYMPRSILFWRAFTQWLGGLGILSFFLIVTFRGALAHHIYGAESHKISSGRPSPGLFSTLRILWTIYIAFTFLGISALSLEQMPVFDSVCHTLTALSTGGFSPHDSSIEFYRLSGHSNYRLIEYTLIVLMILGGMNFLVHCRVIRRDFKALWDSLEIRYWWRLILIFTVAIAAEHIWRNGGSAELYGGGAEKALLKIEETFRNTIFQVVSILTTTGFATEDIGSNYFGVVARQLFLAMMVIGGCVGSTGGGIKVLRIAILNRLVHREIFKARVSSRASADLVVDGKIVPGQEIQRVAGLFFAWIAFLLVGGAVTAILSSHGAVESLSGMFSALGNIGPCYISGRDMIALNPGVKITYIIGMLAGRLEILPVLMLFSRRAWR
ncbi:MAG: TrkH family potassium uptake protein [Planctomycetota bacterium]|jgi:trk system potassium uptake protein TrkH